MYFYKSVSCFDIYSAFIYELKDPFNITVLFFKDFVMNAEAYF